jgi:hypothetical protein
MLQVRTQATLTGRMLAYALVCSRMLTYADVCSRAGAHSGDANRLWGQQYGALIPASSAQATVALNRLWGQQYDDAAAQATVALNTPY